MSIEISHDAPRALTPDPDELPKVSLSELAAPLHDPVTHRFAHGNPGWRLRMLKQMATAPVGALLGLEPDKVAQWLRAPLREAQEHQARLTGELVVQSERLNALVADLARARLFEVVLLAESAKPDVPPKVAAAMREESRAWMRETRQLSLTIDGIERAEAKGRRGASDPDDLGRMVRAAKVRKQ